MVNLLIVMYALTLLLSVATESQSNKSPFLAPHRCAKNTLCLASVKFLWQEISDQLQNASI